MKKILCLLLAALLLCGCRNPAVETTGSQMQTTPADTSPDEEAAKPQERELAFTNPGKVRITYTGAVAQIKYITSVDQLPNEEALAGFDAEFFKNHALLIVMESQPSGSVRLEIESIQVSGDTAVVDIKRTMDGEVGTTDMATWLLWAEVEQGLDYTWRIKDRAEIPAGEKY